MLRWRRLVCWRSLFSRSAAAEATAEVADFTAAAALAVGASMAAAGFTAGEDSLAEGALDLVAAGRLAAEDIAAATAAEAFMVAEAVMVGAAAATDGVAEDTVGAAEAGDVVGVGAGDLVGVGRGGDGVGAIPMATMATDTRITPILMITTRATTTATTIRILTTGVAIRRRQIRTHGRGEGSRLISTGQRDLGGRRRSNLRLSSNRDKSQRLRREERSR